MTELFRWFVFSLGLSMAAGTLLSLSRHPAWFIRGWDFPRVHIALLAAVSGAIYLPLFFSGQWYEWIFLLGVATCIVWQIYGSRGFARSKTATLTPCAGRKRTCMAWPCFPG